MYLSLTFHLQLDGLLYKELTEVSPPRSHGGTTSPMIIKPSVDATHKLTPTNSHQRYQSISSSTYSQGCRWGPSRYVEAMGLHTWPFWLHGFVLEQVFGSSPTFVRPQKTKGSVLLLLTSDSKSWLGCYRRKRKEVFALTLSVKYLLLRSYQRFVLYWRWSDLKRKENRSDGVDDM